MDKFTIRKLDGYTIMPNKPLRDKSLSYGARGLLGFMLTLPEDWDYSFNGLVKVSKEGKAAVRTLINELKEAKYIKISQFRNEKGYYQYNYEVYEIPYDMFVKTANNPTPDFQTTDERNSDNQQQINTKRINTNQQIDKIDKNDKTKHKALINELVRLDYIKEDDEQIKLTLHNSIFAEVERRILTRELKIRKAVLEFLKGKGIHCDNNNLSYNDAVNVSVLMILVDFEQKSEEEAKKRIIS